MASNLINFYEFIKQDETPNPNYETHRIKIPFRALVCCSSGGGKSNLILNLMAQMSNTFTKIVIVSKEEEPLYNYLQEKIKKGLEIHYQGSIPELNKMSKGQSGLVVFDDLVLDKKPQIGEMYIRGRKLGYSSVYISQSFYQTDKIIRQNCNIIWLGYGMQSRDLKMILSEFALSINLNDLVKMYNEITAQKMNFMMINFEDRTIRKNINEIVINF